MRQKLRFRGGLRDGTDAFLMLLNNQALNWLFKASLAAVPLAKMSRSCLGRSWMALLPLNTKRTACPQNWNKGGGLQKLLIVLTVLLLRWNQGQGL